MGKLNPVVRYFQRVFAFDLRSLALFRILLGGLVLVDLLFRLPTLVDMYTGEGLFTRELSFQYHDVHFANTWPGFLWSLFWVSDSPAFTYSLFGIAAVAAVMIMLGKWTKIATAVCWLVIASLHVRNPMVTSSGDFMFKMMLLWSLFLPLDVKWSLNSSSTKADKNLSIQTASIATVGYLFQLFVLYFFSGIAKWNEVWLSGDAMEYVLRLNIYIREFGNWLLQYPGLLKATSWATLSAEVFLIWTLFVAWKNSFWRLLAMFVFVSFHIGIAASMGIGLFPWICIVAWVPLLPSNVWGLFSKPCEPESEPDDFVDNETSTAPSQDRSTFQIAGDMFCVVALAMMLIWNISNVERFNKLRLPLMEQVGYQLAINQQFQMFGEPPSENPWFVYEGILPGGKTVDLWTNAEVDHAKPASGLTTFPRFHWRKFHRNALHSGNEFIHQPMLDFAVAKWNASHADDEKLLSARLICYREPIGPDYNNTDKFSHTWATYSNPNSAGSLFDSLLEEDDLPF